MCVTVITVSSAAGSVLLVGKQADYTGYTGEPDYDAILQMSTYCTLVLSV